MNIRITALATAALAIVASHQMTHAAVLDGGSVDAQGQLSVYEPIAPIDPIEQDVTFTAAFPSQDSVTLDTLNVANSLDYAFGSTADGGAAFSISAASFGDDSPQSSAEASLTVSFDLTEATDFTLDAAAHTLPAYFGTSIDGLALEMYPDHDGPLGIGGNLLEAGGELSGTLEAGTHTFTFDLVGAGHRGGATWSAAADATLQLRPSSSLDVVATPEPTSGALLGLAALTAFRRRRRA